MRRREKKGGKGCEDWAGRQTGGGLGSGLADWRIGWARGGALAFICARILVIITGDTGHRRRRSSLGIRYMYST
jgi:hypothetical protein